ncbi:MAG: hypothetical protein WBA76_19495 [Phormidesmis sp.]
MELTDKISDKSTYTRMVSDCTQLIDEQVSAKTGLSGIALKTTYKLVKGVSQDYISGAVRRLLPETLTALSPIWTEGAQQGDPVSYLSQHSDRTADVILSTTDARIAKNGGGIIGASYSKLRPSVKRDVVDAVPKLARIIGKHVDS